MPLKIIKASAGSGKTFRLTVEYLVLCFRSKNPFYFQHILAITFTNKATAEMKERILESIKGIADGNDNVDSISEIIQERSGLNKSEMKTLAKEMLRNMIFEYDTIQIFTIDSFLYRLFLSISPELKISSTTEVELDAQRVLGTSIQLFLDDIDANADEWKAIDRLLQDRDHASKKFNIYQELEQIGGLLSQEQYFQSSSSGVAKDVLETTYKDMKSYQKQCDDHLKRHQEKFRGLLNQAHMSPDDFSYKKSSWINYFLGEEKSFSDIYLGKRVLAVYHEGADMLPKKTTDELVASLATIEPQLQETLTSFFESEFDDVKYRSISYLLDKWDLFTILQSLDKHRFVYFLKENKIDLPLIGRIIQQEVQSNDIPLIYEKIGQKINHLLIDEFQDTSELQWANLQPIIDECLSRGEDCLLVGDVKQSIYRFRNGNWRLLHELIPATYPNVEIDYLEYNYRSKAQIISFNNELFNSMSVDVANIIQAQCSELRPDLPYHEWARSIYENSAQKFPGTSSELNDGYIEAAMITDAKENDYLEFLFERLENILIDIQNRGSVLGDIAILVSRKKEASLISQMLQVMAEANPEYSFKHVLEESSMYGQIPMVLLLVACLKADQPEVTHLAHVEVLEMLDAINYSGNIDGLLNQVEVINGGTYRIYERFLAYIDLFKLNENESHINIIEGFLGFVLKQIARDGNDLNKFIRYWDDKGRNEKLTLGKDENAIQIITVHKSKGLQFPVVILPFFNVPFAPRKSAGQMTFVNANPITKFQAEFPVSHNKELANTLFNQPYYEEESLRKLDVLNSAYVACTRAKDELYLMSNYSEKNISGIGELLYRHIKDNNVSNNADLISYKKGQKSNKKEQSHSSSVQLLNSFPVRKNLPLVSSNKNELDLWPDMEADPRSRGIALHAILEKIDVVEDVEGALDAAKKEGRVDPDQISLLQESLSKMLTSSEIVIFFEDYTQLKKERSIILRNGDKYIPDRVVEKANETLVLDYKTGEERDRDRKQLHMYAKILEDMGYPKVRPFIWYLGVDKLVEL